MQPGRTFGQALKTLAVCLLLLPFAAAQVFAPGTMPGHGARGVEVVLCTDGGLQAFVIDAQGVAHPAEETPSDPHDPLCAWATATHLVADLASPVLASPQVLSRALARVTLGALPARAGLAPVPPARAPPVAV